MLNRATVAFLLLIICAPNIAFGAGDNFWGLSESSWVCSNVGDPASNKTVCLPVNSAEPADLVATAAGADDADTENIPLSDVTLTPADPDYFVQFPNGGTTLTPLYLEHMRILALVFNGPILGQACVKLIGHSDSVGSDAQNLSIARNRAAAVGDFLIGAGVAADRIVVDTKGEMAPLPKLDATDPRQRRVEILLADRGDTCAP